MIEVEAVPQGSGELIDDLLAESIGWGRRPVGWSQRRWLSARLTARPLPKSRERG